MWKVILIGLLMAGTIAGVDRLRAAREQAEVARLCEEAGEFDDDQRRRPRYVIELCGSGR